MSENEQFGDWYNSFLKTRKGKAAISVLEKLKDSSGNFGTFRKQVLYSCYQAAKFDVSEDWALKQRKKDAQILKEVQKHRQTIGATMQFIRRRPDAAGSAFAGTLLSLKDEILIEPIDDGMNCDLILARVLEEYAKQLENKFCVTAPASALYRVKYGCLVYAKPISPGNLPNAATMLAFSLELFIRKFSLGNNCIQYGETIPNKGKPNYPLIALLVTASLPKASEDQKKLRERVSKLKRENNGIGFIGWETQPT